MNRRSFLSIFSGAIASPLLPNSGRKISATSEKPTFPIRHRTGILAGAILPREAPFRMILIYPH